MNYCCTPQGSLVEVYWGKVEEILELNSFVVAEPVLYFHKQEEEVDEVGAAQH